MANHDSNPNADVPVPGGGFSDSQQANLLLAEALRKSFRVLKFVMLVLVVLYFISGWFTVEQGEAAVVVRFGELVTEAGKPKVYREGWHLAWPFPIDRWETVQVKERQIDVEFMLYLTNEERTTGRIKQKFSNLTPERDDYLVTGDANILHASLSIKYKISDVIDYVTHVYPMADPKADPKSTLLTKQKFKRYPEYTVLRNLARDAVIETAASQRALDIRGSRQDAFLFGVARAINRKLAALDARGAPLGLSIDEDNGVIAPKSASGALEAIMPPRQTQQVFDQVFAAQTNKSVAITKAQSAAEALLVNAAGPGYRQVAEAIDKELALMRQTSAAETKAGGDPEDAALKALRESLARQRAATEAMLFDATGLVQFIINAGRIRRDRIVKEATGDHSLFMKVLPEYLKNPQIFLSRLSDDVQARALANDGVTKIYLSEASQYRLQIPRDKTSGPRKKETEKPGASGASSSILSRPTLRQPVQ